MSRVWLGTATGAGLGLILVGLLILLPRTGLNTFYEVGDALLVMGLPLLVIAAAVGAMAGAASRRHSQGNVPIHP